MPRVIFLRPPGPGALVRLMERHGDPSAVPAEAFLSDATSGGWRALVSDSPILDPWTEPLVRAFPAEAWWFSWDMHRWEWLRCAEGEANQSGGDEIVSRRAWWTRLPGWPRVDPEPLAFARRQGLPMQRAFDQAIPIVEFASIDALDQRGLLHEDGPRLYRLQIQPPARV